MKVKKAVSGEGPVLPPALSVDGAPDSVVSIIGLVKYGDHLSMLSFYNVAC